MKYILSMSYLIIATLLLTGCGPIYHTEYNYVPPKTPNGQMCISQCVQSKSMCQQMCQMRTQTCRSQARQNALLEYELYKNDREHNGQKVKKNVDDFDRSYDCDDNCDCQPQFNACYTSCGGQVQPHQVCDAFCDKASSSSPIPNLL